MEAKATKPSAAEGTASYKSEARSSVRDFMVARKQPDEVVPVGNGDFSVFIRKMTTSSVVEIEKVMDELKEARDYLNSESERLQREAARYGQLSETASVSAKTISETLVQWRQADSPVRS